MKFKKNKPLWGPSLKFQTVFLKVKWVKVVNNYIREALFILTIPNC